MVDHCRGNSEFYGSFGLSWAQISNSNIMLVNTNLSGMCGRYLNRKYNVYLISYKEYTIDKKNMEIIFENLMPYCSRLIKEKAPF
jgi:hypothetical protein